MSKKDKSVRSSSYCVEPRNPRRVGRQCSRGQGANSPGRANANVSSEQLMYRAKQDGPALLGLKHPWDH